MEVKRVDEITVGVRVIGLFCGAAIGGNGLIEQTLILQRIAQILHAFGVIRAQCDRPMISDDRLIEFAFACQGVAQIIVSFGIVGHEGNRPTIGGDGFIELSRRFQHIAQLAVGFGEIRTQHDRGSMRRWPHQAALRLQAHCRDCNGLRHNQA